MNNLEINIGIDTSQYQLDIGIRPFNELFLVTNDQDGICDAIKRIISLKPTRVCSLKLLDDLKGLCLCGF